MLSALILAECIISLVNGFNFSLIVSFLSFSLSTMLVISFDVETNNATNGVNSCLLIGIKIFLCVFRKDFFTMVSIVGLPIYILFNLDSCELRYKCMNIVPEKCVFKKTICLNLGQSCHCSVMFYKVRSSLLCVFVYLNND